VLKNNFNPMTLLKFLIYAVAILITAYLLPGVFLAGPVVAIIVALVLSLINMFIKPLLIILTLPLNILTLGLFTFVINAALILLVSTIVPGFKVANFGWALLFSLILVVINSALKAIISDNQYSTTK